MPGVQHEEKAIATTVRAPAALLDELGWRGLIAEMSEGLAQRLARGPVAGYIGFDASARSLHVGNLLQVFMLTHLQRHGGTPFVVIGGGTGMIGDPSGKSSERNLLDDAQIAANSAAIRRQLERFVDFTAGPTQAQLVDNREWLARYSLLDFLRYVGKHFSVPYMLAKESVQQRLAAGLSFTEFSYMTLQAADFLHLYRERGVELQMGGADQWGNITAGLELIRRVVGRAEGEEPPALGLCSPLLLTRAGVKMGKSEKGAVFLDPALTSPYDFYQYWLNDDDALVAQHLRWLTLLEADEIHALEEEMQRAPEGRAAQRALAFDLTARVHGTVEAEKQAELRRVVRSFGVNAVVGPAEPAPEELEKLYGETGFEVTDAVLSGTAIDVAMASGLFASRSDARRTMAQGGVFMNQRQINDGDVPIPPLYADKYLVVRVGKKRLKVGRRPDRETEPRPPEHLETS
ncbi:MAG: tyrosine--tRNA ligase [Chloroflexota bacterium]|nr:tyrosine--tRNA ligase [Chloroflexota bacterium]